MKKQDKKKLRDQTLSALQDRLEKEEKEIIKLKIELKAGKLKDVHEFKKKRNVIAVVKTVINEKKLAEEVKS